MRASRARLPSQHAHCAATIIYTQARCTEPWYSVQSDTPDLAQISARDGFSSLRVDLESRPTASRVANRCATGALQLHRRKPRYIEHPLCRANHTVFAHWRSQIACAHAESAPLAGSTPRVSHGVLRADMRLRAFAVATTSAGKLRRLLAFRLARWSTELPQHHKRFIRSSSRAAWPH
jgi:hypothetical protein